MGKSQEELDVGTSQSRMGAHELLLNKIVEYISSLKNKDSQDDALILRRVLP